MLIKGCNAEDFTNYKKTSMFIIFPFCDFKCDKENGSQFCQNWSLSKQQAKDIPVDTLVEQYINDPITHAVVCGGLEPMRSFDSLLELTEKLRAVTDDDIVIFTGYNEDEIQDELNILKQYPKILVKFGRFRPNLSAKLDENLGVTLASSNQYSKWIS